MFKVVFVLLCLWKTSIFFYFNVLGFIVPDKSKMYKTKQNKDNIEGKEEREKGREGKNREKEWGVVQTLTMLTISGGAQNELPLTRGLHWELGKHVWPNCVTHFSEKSHLWNQGDVHCSSVQKDLSCPSLQLSHFHKTLAFSDESEVFIICLVTPFHSTYAKTSQAFREKPILCVSTYSSLGTVLCLWNGRLARSSSLHSSWSSWRDEHVNQ